MVETVQARCPNQQSNEKSRVCGDACWLKQPRLAVLTNSQTKYQGFAAMPVGLMRRHGIGLKEMTYQMIGFFVIIKKLEATYEQSQDYCYRLFWYAN